MAAQISKYCKISPEQVHAMDAMYPGLFVQFTIPDAKSEYPEAKKYKISVLELRRQKLDTFAKAYALNYPTEWYVSDKFGIRTNTESTPTTPTESTPTESTESIPTESTESIPTTEFIDLSDLNTNLSELSIMPSIIQHPVASSTGGEIDDETESEDEDVLDDIEVNTEVVPDATPSYSVIGEVVKNLADFQVKGKDLITRIMSHVMQINSPNYLLDVGEIDFVPEPYKVEPKPLKPIGNMFCDNIILISFASRHAIQKSVGNKDILNSVDAGYLNSTIREMLNSAGIRPDMVKTKLPYKLNNSSDNAKKLREFLESKPEALDKILDNCKQRYLMEHGINDLYYVPYKVDLTSIDFDDLITRLGSVFVSLNSIGVFLHDIDITIDNAGTMDPVKLLEHMYGLGFAMQGTLDAANAENVILDNDGMVGKDCITWMSATYGLSIRSKLYNKFVCQVTSPGVSSGFGNHLYNYLYPPTGVLKNVFRNPETVNNGATRIEITIYGFELLRCYQYHALIKDKVLDPIASRNLFYSVPLAVQWQEIEQRVTSNIICIDRENQKLNAAYWVNKTTGKVTGVTKTHNNPATFERMVKHFITNFSYPFKPCLILDVAIEGENIIIKHDTLIKDDPDSYAIICSGSAVLSAPKNPVDLNTTALIGSKLFGVPSKSILIHNALRFRYPVQAPAEFQAVPNVFTKKEWDRINEQAKYATEENEAKRILLEHVIDLEQRRKDLLEYRQTRDELEDQARQYAQYADRIRRNFSNGITPLTDLELNKAHKVIALKLPRLGGDIKYNTVLLQLENGTICYIGGYLLKCLESTIPTLPRRLIEGDEQYVGNRYAPVVIMEFKIPYLTTYNGNPCAKYTEIKILGKSHILDAQNKINISKSLEAKQAAEAVRQQIENTNFCINTEITQNDLPEDLQILKTTSVKPTACKSLNDLEPGIPLTITSITPITYRGVARYIFQVKEDRVPVEGYTIPVYNNTTYYISNYWLQKALETVQLIPGTSPLIVYLVSTRTTPTKKKEMFVVVA